MCCEHCKYQHCLEYAPTKDILDGYKKKSISWNEYEEMYTNLILNRGDYKNFCSKFADFQNVCLLCSEPTACRSLPQEMRDFPVDPRSLREKYCKDIDPAVIHAAAERRVVVAHMEVVVGKADAGKHLVDGNGPLAALVAERINQFRNLSRLSGK